MVASGFHNRAAPHPSARSRRSQHHGKHPRRGAYRHPPLPEPGSGSGPVPDRFRGQYRHPPLPEPGGFPDISRWLRSNATTPPVWIPNMPHPGGMPARPARMCRTSTHPSFHPPPPGPSANARPPEQTCIPLSLPTSPSSPRLRASARAPVFLPPRSPHPPNKKRAGSAFANPAQSQGRCHRSTRSHRLACRIS